MPYASPVNEFRFLLDHVVDFAQVQQTELFDDASSDVTDAILTEAGRMCDEILAPLRRNGDLYPAALENGVVRASLGFDTGYKAIADGGWIGISASAEHGGMGLPLTLGTCLNDMMSGACLSLQLLPLLTQGQIEALERHASEQIRSLYLPRLVSGEWAGTMNLTEPQAGSDVGAVQSRATDNGDGTFEVSGQKIFISWGDHDLTENICHLVLARLPDAAPGTRGISLFLVPKFIPDPTGKPGVANSVKVVSLEHKMGLHGSPTAVLQFEGATGWMVGEPGGGMAAMFTMMNNARLGVGVQGVGAAEGAFQHALAYARERKQGRTPTGDGTIADHADVRRMLTETRADIFASRAIALSCAVALDMAKATDAAEWQTRAAFLTPIAKAFGTQVGMDVAREGVQIHGGMGVIEETGAAQFSRDVRVTAIYEGTNGIQSMDLVARKMMDGGEAAFRLLDEVQKQAEVSRQTRPDLAGPIWDTTESLRETTDWLVQTGDMTQRFAGATAYLRAFARVLGAHFHLRAALADEANGHRATMAEIYVSRLLPEADSLLRQARAGSDALYRINLDDLVA